MDKDQFKQLAKKYLSNELTKEEFHLFLSELAEQEHTFYEVLDNQITPEPIEAFDKEAAFEKLVQDDRFGETPAVRRLVHYGWIAAACSVIAVIGVFVYLNLTQPRQTAHTRIASLKKEAGKTAENPSKAIRLADGTQLALKDISAKVTDYNGIRLSRVSANLYKIGIAEPGYNPKHQYHEFTAGKGFSYSLLLPDGSRVDLNSATTLRLDPGFNKSNRNCELEGEAYFDVRKNKKMAFKVTTRDYDIKVLGTQFNIKSYPHTTYSQTALVNGKVHIVQDKKEVDLLPGDQISARGGILEGKSKANMREILAWKEGYFRFTNAGIKDIMDDIRTWYDIRDIDYLETSHDRFTGSVTRTRSLNEVLHSIEKISNLKFEIKEGRIIVRK